MGVPQIIVTSKMPKYSTTLSPMGVIMGINHHSHNFTVSPQN